MTTAHDTEGADLEVVEVVDAEIVDDELLPTTLTPAAPAKPPVDRHTILYPGQDLATRADAPSYTRRDFEVSPATAERLQNKSKPKNTNRNYTNQRRLFAEWCEAMGRVARPCTTATYVEWVAGMIARDMSPNTISTYMSGVRTWMPPDLKPDNTEARGMLNEHRKDWGKRNRVRKAPPITRPMLEAMVGTCDLRHPIGLRDRCALLIGRAALNRRIELADLDIEDVEVEEDGIAEWVAFSKTDQAAEGQETWIPADPDNPLYDPVEAVRDWLNCLHRLGVRNGPLLRALTSAGTLQNRSTATLRGDYVTGDAVNDWVRGRAYKAGLKDWHKITAHGLRRGGAQEIADAGGDPTKQGRWKEGSATVKKEYLDRAQTRAENPWHKVAEKRRAEAAQQ
ncbi:integrase (plasmid) [Streptomyces sp. NA02950]|uniref:integrase n=1 Tax=Streptomyces sp. NA02950 TaxID=2742137 RepID=UPI001590780F|nr:integrase [Streptomyces sp. NA02950]QKV98218.1 integrase [Streptomyces sp. NA02950]